MNIQELCKNPKNITVYTEEVLLKARARVLSKKVLRNVVSNKCDLFKQGECNLCFTDKQEIEQPCHVAWKLTIGKGKKVY